MIILRIGLIFLFFSLESCSNDEISFLQQELSAPDNVPNTQENTNTMPFQLQGTSYPLETPQFGSNAENSPRYTSSGNITMTPKLRRYIRDRKKFLKLRTPDINSPRKARLNLEYGQKTVLQHRKEIATLQQQVRRLQKQVKTFKDLLQHLEKENKISSTVADKFLVSVEEIYVY
ncbi:uncharacterized protein LOC135844051 isoform X1 [Planococcus citri]|uniref:uncharacterized protein LOC135844051 isoform X1 n=1 Tax=Planococcus citri TaxID=170843 RepID=UPI0031F97109